MERMDRNRSRPQRAGDVLANLMARKGYAQQMTASACAEAWVESVGTEWSSASRPGNVRRGVLEVTVANSSVLHELTFRRRQLVTELRRLIPEQNIENIRFRIGIIS